MARSSKSFQKIMKEAEDAYFSQIADERCSKNAGFVSHEEFWSKVLAND